MNRQVVAVDADPYNLAYIRKSLDLEGNTHNVRIIYNSVRSLLEKEIENNKVGYPLVANRRAFKMFENVIFM